VPDLLHHELDLAWHAIEQAHEHGVLFPRQPRGCQQCRSTPAVRVTLHSVEPGGFRARTKATSVLMCRECGLRACRETQRQTLRQGWWGALAPFANLRAITRNSTERAFLRRVEPAAPRPRSGAGETPRRNWRKHDVGGDRRSVLLAGLAAAALILGVTIPGGTTSPEHPAKPSTSVSVIK
jgi:hypothetical protein